ncbi:lytic transglycosylase domain-containing protein [Pseudomonas aeruginosa]|nr:lytic transglycosylase domain-containing protein [Pseudomonas aeruginosa]
MLQPDSLFKSFVFVLLVLLASSAHAFSLKGTMWERVSQSSSCKAPALLLYSIALQESRSSAGKGMVRPHPFALRNGPSGSKYPESSEEATELLERFIAEDRLTDIGMMQINYRWNGHRVSNPALLLNAETNVSVAAEILCEAISVQRGDIELAIGGYHTMNPKREIDARAYARSVLHIWRSLQKLERNGG